MKRWILLLFSSGLFLSAQADDRQLSSFQYWFDDNQTEMTETSISGTKQTINQSIDASQLREGMHRLYFRVGDDQGLWSPLQQWAFFVKPLRDKGAKAINTVEYWLDTNSAERKSVVVNGNLWQQMIDVSDLSEGMHTLNYRFGDNYGDYGALQQWVFFVKPLRDKGAKAINTVEYWLDTNSAERKSEVVNDNLWQQTIDVSDLSEGMHTLNYRFGDNYGDYGALQQAVFMKLQQKATQIKKLRYWWSNRTDLIEEVDVGQPSFTYESLLAVPDHARQDPITDQGVARLNCIAIDDQGRQSAPFYQDVIYAIGPTLFADRYSQTAGSNIAVSWTYTDVNGVKDYIVYYAKDNEPYVMYIPSTTANTVEFKGTKGVYRFLVVARNNAGQRTNMDDEWTIIVTFE